MKCEVVEFKLNEEVTTEQFLNELDNMYTKFWKKQTGFVKGEILQNNNNWIHFMYWKKKEDIINSSKLIKESATKIKFFSMIQENSVKVSLFNSKKIY